ncbi:MAG TPA: post-transcriptional regulator [Candidatus Paenibacillus intestinavium]|nr:post-transcriptional regulator [Candidatus Paenibacillus intestinavium]
MEELCTSKAEELHLLGYEHVKAKEVWACVSSRYVKSGQPQLHQLVNDILSLRATHFMNYLMLSAYKGDSFE